MVLVDTEIVVEPSIQDSWYNGTLIRQFQDDVDSNADADNDLRRLEIDRRCVDTPRPAQSRRANPASQDSEHRRTGVGGAMGWGWSAAHGDVIVGSYACNK